MNENERWYVRAAVSRGMASLRNDIEEGERYLATDPPATFAASVRGMVSYNKQMLQEMERYVPKDLQ